MLQVLSRDVVGALQAAVEVGAEVDGVDLVGEGEARQAVAEVVGKPVALEPGGALGALPAAVQAPAPAMDADQDRVPCPGGGLQHLA